MRFKSVKLQKTIKETSYPVCKFIRILPMKGTDEVRAANATISQSNVQA